MTRYDSDPQRTTSSRFDRHRHTVFRPQRDDRLKRDGMTADEPQSPPLRDGRERNDPLEPCELLADAHTWSAAEREVRELRTLRLALGREPLRVESLRIRKPT